MFKPEDVISSYTSQQAAEDGIFVPVTPKDAVTRTVFTFFGQQAPGSSKPPNRWPVDMMGWFRAEAFTKKEAAELIVKHGTDAQAKSEEIVRDRKAVALARGIIGTHAAAAKRKYVEGGIYKLWAQSVDGKLNSLTVNEADAFDTRRELWLLPNDETGGVTLMFPEDY
jgi:hypothetical protein